MSRYRLVQEGAIAFGVWGVFRFIHLLGRRLVQLEVVFQIDPEDNTGGGYTMSMYSLVNTKG